MTSLRGYAQLLGREFERGVPPTPTAHDGRPRRFRCRLTSWRAWWANCWTSRASRVGKLAIEPRATDLSQVVREVLDSARQQFNGHTLVARLPEELPAHVDPLRIEQVVTNLIDNAIKYSPEGGQIDVVLDPDSNATQSRSACAIAVSACRWSIARTSSIVSTRRMRAGR